ncbi:Retrovirus-related Pol polyprotein from transposon TNT 1-94 [Eumeta japonica]|uniref:Retrovirus-related Pol polyprotein from transposon TNT 1-94 n=1 Tax=Eumeta variegata TaxID=151549 RepID=A0A4C1ZSN8_EUMVA|nr:Retrovirus-related Pol polyprotein from transposon TNT 1-94 [Eumeta japonica]
MIIRTSNLSAESVKFVKTKDKIKHIIEDFINKAENITGNKVKTVRSDNGLEFENRDVKEIFTSRGITHQTTVPYTPEQNGKVERENRTLVVVARTMIHERNLPKKLWAEAISRAVFVLNRTGKSREDGISPFEVWTGKTYDIHRLRAFGTEVYVHIPKERRRKWDKKEKKCLMVGYEEDVKGYRIYYAQKNTVEIKWDIVFLQEEEKEKPQAKGGEGQTVVSLNLEEETVQESSPETGIDEIVIPELKETTHASSILENNSESDSDYLPCSEEEHLIEGSSPPREERTKRVRK